MSICSVLGIVLVLGIKKKTDLAYYIFLTALLRYSTHTTWFTHLMYTIQWFLVHTHASQYSIYSKSHDIFY